MCLELGGKANKDPTFISKIIMGDDSWIYGYDPETRQQLLQRKSPQSQSAKWVWQVQSSTKRMLIFVYVKGIVHCEFFPPNTMVNSDFYCDVLRHSRENV
jgi:hypothetical protein